jgi:hypothetical protein
MIPKRWGQLDVDSIFTKMPIAEKNDHQKMGIYMDL